MKDKISFQNERNTFEVNSVESTVATPRRYAICRCVAISGGGKKSRPNGSDSSRPAAMRRLYGGFEKIEANVTLR